MRSRDNVEVTTVYHIIREYKSDVASLGMQSDSAPFAVGDVCKLSSGAGPSYWLQRYRTDVLLDPCSCMVNLGWDGGGNGPVDALCIRICIKRGSFQPSTMQHQCWLLERAGRRTRSELSGSADPRGHPLEAFILRGGETRSMLHSALLLCPISGDLGNEYRNSPPSIF